jgi:NAD-dependent SIR2 family protein deacetylase
VAKLLENRKAVFITGAGISTDSGIPDYRGKGMLAKNPLIADKFIHDHNYRKKFWFIAARDWADWLYAQPNAGHYAIARMEHYTNSVVGVITQNVDGLHELAGTLNLAEVHGNMFTSSCILCSEQYEQHDVIDKIRDLNPRLGEPRFGVKQIVEPMCGSCGGFLKPNVVFFGDTLPEDQLEFAESMSREADAVIVAGTSMMVGTPHTYVMDIKSRGGPVIVINRGRTAIDNIADIKCKVGLSDFLDELSSLVK